MGKVALYVHTLRYLKPIQVFGRLWFLLPKPSPPAGPAPPERKRPGTWVRPPLNRPALLSPSRFRFLNEEHEVLSAPDWNHPAREKLWLYHLHYFDDLNAEGAGQRAAWHSDLIARWIVENPPGKGNGWEPYPLSRRIVNWIRWSLEGGRLPPEAAASLALQARCLRKRLEWHLLGNHLLANAKALIFAGLFFEGREAERWLAKGAEIFSRQLAEQVLADGGHFERSPLYHAQVLADTLDVLNIRQAFSKDGKAFSPLFSGETVRRMLGWLKTMTHPDGGIALLNDSAFGDAPETAALETYAAALGIGPSPPDERGDAVPLIRHLEDSGYLRVDCGEMAAFLDAAPIGPDCLPGHAHADTLGFELSLGPQRVIVDSGVSRYGFGPERDRQRGTAAHNTVQINGQDSSEVWGGFRVARRAYPRDLRVSTEDGTVSCAHDGYRRLPGKPVHRREWRFRPGGLQIRDTITGHFREAVARIYFHPTVKVVLSSGSYETGRIILPSGQEIIWQVEMGRVRILNTTWHPEFGLVIPNRCMEIVFIKHDISINLTI